MGLTQLQRANRRSLGKQQAERAAVRAALTEGLTYRPGTDWALPSWVSRQLRCPKVSKGERREAGIQWIQPPKAVSDPEFRQTTSGAHGSANRADCLPRGKPFGAPAGAYPLPRVELDAPTPARTVGLPPRGGQYFLSKRKKVPKKASGTATPEAARPASRNSQISAFRALPCPALVFAQACQSLTAYGSCAHWARAPSRPKLRSAGAERLDAPNKFGASNSGP